MVRLDVILALLCLHTLTLAASNVCSTGIYKRLRGLANFAPALQYCSKRYPVPVVTVTSGVDTMTVFSVTVICVPSPTDVPAGVEPRTPAANKASVYAELRQQSASVIKTACSCIEVPETLMVASSTTITTQTLTSVEFCTTT